jgi:hypothetical protein
MNRLFSFAATIVAAGVFSCFGQTAGAYDDDGKSTKSGLLDPSKLTVHHSLSFGAMSGNGSSLKSQSMYATMIQYSFAKPLTLNLNFGLPLYSSFSAESNLSPENIKSAEYFMNMPINASLSWAPSRSFTMRFSFIRDPEFNTIFSPAAQSYARSMMPFGW